MKFSENRNFASSIFFLKYHLGFAFNLANFCFVLGKGPTTNFFWKVDLLKKDTVQYCNYDNNDVARENNF